MLTLSRPIELPKSSHHVAGKRAFAAGVQKGTLPFARRDTAPDRQSRYEPQCVSGLEAAANRADTCAWCTLSTAAASVLWKHER